LQTLLGNPLVADPDALYIVWAGFNDVYFGDDPAPIDLNQSIANMRTIFDQLADAGARYLMVPSILDVGRWPVAGPYQDSLSLRTRVYNAKLELLIEEVAAQGRLRFIAPAIYDGVEYIMEAPGSFGYSYTTELCEDYVDVS
jgi:phospholipase/lecithinase/hemolysin